MNSFTVLLLCIQVFLAKNVLSQCHGNYGAERINNAGLGYGAGIPNAPAAISAGTGFGNGVSAGLGYGNAPAFAAPALAGNLGNIVYNGASSAAYGGAGEGNVAVTGDVPVTGNAAVSGQIPIMGIVNFSGNLPAAGSVSISGVCGCAGY